MPKLGVVATISVEPGRRDEYLIPLMAHRARSLKDEPGTLLFEIVVPQGDDSSLLVFEVYQDEAAFEAHMKSPSIARWREERAGIAANIAFKQGSLVS